VYVVLEASEGPLKGRKLVVAEERAKVAAGFLKLALPGEKEPAAGWSKAEITSQFAGQTLVGLEYTRPFDIVPLPEDKRHSVVVPGAFVTSEDGSGIVHMAPAFGADDYAAGKEHNLALVRPVGADGTFTGTSWPEIEGKLVTAEETNDTI